MNMPKNEHWNEQDIKAYEEKILKDTKFQMWRRQREGKELEKMHETEQNGHSQASPAVEIKEEIAAASEKFHLLTDEVDALPDVSLRQLEQTARTLRNKLQQVQSILARLEKYGHEGLVRLQESLRDAYDQLKHLLEIASPQQRQQLQIDLEAVQRSFAAAMRKLDNILS
jgi:ABC-type transporter Mla subunit MlaD